MCRQIAEEEEKHDNTQTNRKKSLELADLDEKHIKDKDEKRKTDRHKRRCLT